MSPRQQNQTVTETKNQNKFWWFMYFLRVFGFLCLGLLLLIVFSLVWPLIPTTIASITALILTICLIASGIIAAAINYSLSSYDVPPQSEPHGSFDGTLTEADGLPTQFTIRFENAWQKPIFDSTSQANQSDPAIIDLGNAEVIIDTQSGWTTITAQKGINLVVNDGDQRTRIHYGL
jgi:ABC-type transport system involved in multi-copper enzyme maturation permease subunit